MKRVLSIILTAVMLLGSLSVLAAVPAVAAETKVVLVPEKPTGAGTEAEPYLVAKPEHFYWIQQNTNDPEMKTQGKGDFTAYDINSCPSFEGVYFKQMADLDFSGYKFKEKKEAYAVGGAQHRYNTAGTESDAMGPIGFYNIDTYDAYGDKSKEANHFYGGFAGNYDGNGYSIKNLKIQHRTGYGTNYNRAVGLFGVIYGATLKNMVLDNVDVVSNTALAGILVGKAYAPVYSYRDKDRTDLAATAIDTNFDYNVIENILITDTCSVTSKGGTYTDANNDILPKATVSNSTVTAKDGSKPAAGGHFVGGIVGVAIDTTVKNSLCQGDVNVGYTVVAAGGIIGSIASSVLVDGCIFEGDINFSNLENVTKNAGSEKAFGGIVGCIETDIRHSDLNRKTPTGFIIQNCINKGGFNYDISTADVKTEYWGGILGGCQNLMPLIEGNFKYLIKNSHNIATPSNAGIERFAGIAGCVFLTNNKAASPLYVEDCYSVEVAVTNKYCETNEVITPTDRQTAAGERPVIFVGANKYGKTTNTAIDVTKMDRVKTKATLALAEPINVENEEKTGCVIGTKTFQALINEMTEEATKNINFDIKPPEEIPEVIVKNKVFAVGGQRYEDGSKYRIILGVNSIDYKKFAVQFVDENWDFVAPETQDAYTSFIETNGTETVTHEASEYGADYLIFFDIPATHYKTTGTCTETINTFAYTKDGTMLKGDKITIVFTDGEVTAAFADTTVGTK